jgi:hypothetical protein
MTERNLKARKMPPAKIGPILRINAENLKCSDTANRRREEKRREEKSPAALGAIAPTRPPGWDRKEHEMSEIEQGS